ncbi:ABC transporter permease [Kaistia sp. 32K]|uniref:ABC transporter permease n=1 Tax=Kaistia sp. 32K TaxID=2795690 RepID=UPI0019159523|nr:ABC transporter permease [Kaistia sp. 32K]BCP52317.1 ABC transporter permease [Kaistia sp. 32K]
MTRHIAIQAALSLLSLLLVSILVFWLVDLLPGDAAERVLGQDATTEGLAVLREQFGLNHSALARYLAWISGLLRGDLGTSMIAGQPVANYVAGRVQNSAILAAFALVLYVPVSLALALLTAVYRGTAVDVGLTVFVLLGMCIPEFVIAIFLVSLFAVTLNLFPALALLDTAQGFGDLVRMLFLPVLTLTAAMSAYSVRLMRESLIQILDSDYIQLARLKGLPNWRIMGWHALPNALGPALNVLALNIAWLIGSIVLVETVFNFDGLGRLLVNSIRYKDTPVIQAIVMLLCAVYVLANLLADVSIMALNPKLRTRR